MTLILSPPRSSCAGQQALRGGDGRRQRWPRRRAGRRPPAPRDRASHLAALIGAIERPDAGTIVSGGTEATALHGAALAAYRRTVGFVFQRYNLLPALTALDNVIAPVLPYRTAVDKPGRGRRFSSTR